MNLILIYGPPAAGKQTVANTLSKMIAYKVFNNRSFNSRVADVFNYDKEQAPILHKLTAKFRLEIFEEAAKANINLITCYGAAGKKRFKFFREVIKVVEKHQGKVILVQLNPSRETLSERVVEESRKNDKIDSKEFLDNYLAKNPDSYDKFPDVEHLTIDNTTLSPNDVAHQIVSHYHLSNKF